MGWMVLHTPVTPVGFLSSTCWSATRARNAPSACPGVAGPVMPGRPYWFSIMRACMRHAGAGPDGHGPGLYNIVKFSGPFCMRVCICMHPGMHTEKARKKPENPYK